MSLLTEVALTSPTKHPDAFKLFVRYFVPNERYTIAFRGRSPHEKRSIASGSKRSTFQRTIADIAQKARNALGDQRYDANCLTLTFVCERS